MHRRASPLPAAGVVLAFVASLFAAQCAKSQCNLNSDCGYRRYCDRDNLCQTDCSEDRDCADGVCDPNGRCVKAPPPDAAPDVAPVDAAPDDVPADAPVSLDRATPIDAPPPIDNPPPVDNPPPIDNPPPVDIPVTPDVSRPRAAFFDPCTIDDDCQSGACSRPATGRSFCSRTCTTRRDCFDGTLCSSTGRCVPDDTGRPCDPRTDAATCARGFCFGNSASGVGHCTRECASGADCPAGYACSSVSGTSVCVEVERRCNRASECPSNFCLGPATSAFRGCTSQCRSAADCPRRMAVDDGTGRLLVLPPYTCTNVEGVNLCVPPIDILGGDIIGSDPIGATCSATGAPNCYSGVCDTGDATSAAACVQGCTPSGGCPSGFACRTWLPDGPTGGLYLVCRPAGTGGLGSTCAVAADCASALCYGSGATGVCTRFCNDGVCPSGMTCTPVGNTVDGTRVALCTR